MSHSEQTDRNRRTSRDMTPQAIGRRLRIVSDLRLLCLKLAQAKKTKQREGKSP